VTLADCDADAEDSDFPIDGVASQWKGTVANVALPSQMSPVCAPVWSVTVALQKGRGKGSGARNPAMDRPQRMSERLEASNTPRTACSPDCTQSLPEEEEVVVVVEAGSRSTSAHVV
jgi:hypothetical protein